MGTCTPAAWPRLPNTLTPGNFQKLLLHVFGKLLFLPLRAGTSWGSLRVINLVPVVSEANEVSLCWQQLRGLALLSVLWRRAAPLQIPCGWTENEVGKEEHFTSHHLEFWVPARAPILGLIPFRTCGNAAFRSKGGGVGVLGLFLLEQWLLSWTLMG